MAAKYSDKNDVIVLYLKDLDFCRQLLLAPVLLYSVQDLSKISTYKLNCFRKEANILQIGLI